MTVPAARCLERASALGRSGWFRFLLDAVPGAPRYRGESINVIIDRAVQDARAHAEVRINGLLIENHGDIPFLPPTCT